MHHKYFALSNKEGTNLLINTSSYKNTLKILESNDCTNTCLFWHDKVEGSAATIFDSYSFNGNGYYLNIGAYSNEKIESDYKLKDGDIRSIIVYNHTVVLLYDGENFEKNKDILLISGPCKIPDFKQLGFDGRVSSVEVLGVIDSGSKPGSICIPVIYEKHNSSTKNLGETHLTKYESGDSKLFFIWIIILFAIIVAAIMNHQYITRLIFPDVTSPNNPNPSRSDL